MSFIGDRIKEEMQRQKISQYRLAKLSSIAQTTISAIIAEGQTRSPSFDTVEKIADALGMTVSTLASKTIGEFDLTNDEKELILSYRQLPQNGKQEIWRQMKNALQDFGGKHHDISAMEEMG